MTRAPRQAACQAREGLKRGLEKKLGYPTATLEQAIDDACYVDIIAPAMAKEMHRARKNMNDIADAKSGGNGSKTPDTNRNWRFYLIQGNRKKHSPRQAAAQARVILRMRIEKLLGYETGSLCCAISHAYHHGIISKKSKNHLHRARLNMNAIVHAKPGGNGSKTPETVPTWRDYIRRTPGKPKKLAKRKKTK